MKLLCGDCLEVLPSLKAGSIDLILADPPYGTTECKWDVVIPMIPLWKQLNRMLKPLGTVILTASQPFTSILVASNLKQFKYEWILVKNRPSDKFNARNKPMRGHENVLVFSKGTTANCSPNRMGYYPQGLQKCSVMVGGNTGNRHHGTRPTTSRREKYLLERTNYPTSVLYFPKDDKETVHATQKPVAFVEYMIRTYSRKGEMVLDFCMGSGTTGVACFNTGRDFIGIESDPTYFAIAENRINGPVPGFQLRRK